MVSRMKTKEMRNYIHNLMVKNNVDIIELPARVTRATGIVWVTLNNNNDIKGEDFDECYVEIKDADIPLIYLFMRKHFKDVHMYELSEKEVEQLEKQIVFGSLYLADYENTLGVSAREVSDYADGYLEAKDDECFGPESFYDYICSVEF